MNTPAIAAEITTRLPAATTSEEAAELLCGIFVRRPHVAASVAKEGHVVVSDTREDGLIAYVALRNREWTVTVPYGLGLEALAVIGEED